MTDRTPHEGGRHTPEDLLDALLAGNRVELLDTMTRTLDTDAGLRALQTLRTGPPAKMEERSSEATAPRTHHSTATHLEYEYADPYAAHEAIKAMRDFIEALTELRRSPDLPWTGMEACTKCTAALMVLAHGLERRAMTRDHAMGLLTEAVHHLKDLQSILHPSFEVAPGLEANVIIVELAEQLQRISVVVARMFHDTYDNISIEY